MAYLRMCHVINEQQTNYDYVTSDPVRIAHCTVRWKSNFHPILLILSVSGSCRNSVLGKYVGKKVQVHCL